jgi:hypothetical protein
VQRNPSQHHSSQPTSSVRRKRACEHHSGATSHELALDRHAAWALIIAITSA